MPVNSTQRVEFFEFTRRAYVLTRSTSSDVDVVLGDFTYDSTYPMSRTGSEASANSARNDIQIKTSRDHPIALMWQQSPPTDKVGVTVFGMRRGDLAAEVRWMGYVANVKFNGEEATLLCESIYNSLNASGLRDVYQVSCPFALYGPDCKVAKENFQHDTELVGKDGFYIEVDSLIDLPWRGGFVERDDDNGNIDLRFILDFTGNILRLSQPFYEAEIGDPLRIFPGCDYSMEMCNGTYNNKLNHGGCTYKPNKNPWNGIQVF